MEGTGEWLLATAAAHNGLVGGARPWSRADRRVALAEAPGNRWFRRRRSPVEGQRQEGKGRSDAARLSTRGTL